MSAADNALALDRMVLERSFKLFVRDAWAQVDGKKLKPNWHMDAICDHLQAVHEGTINRLVINVPPGAGKSLIASVFFPAWVWCTKPKHQIIATSFSMRRTSNDNRRMRKLVESDWYQKRWPTGFAHDQNEKLFFENDKGGSRRGEPFSQMTGARGNLVIVDDPHSVDGAKSVAERTSTTETFVDAIQNRLNDLDEDAIIVIMQRLHEDDVTGVILDRPDLGYEHLVIPMEFEEEREPTIIGWVDPRTQSAVEYTVKGKNGKPDRSVVMGELMHPSHFSAEAVLKLKAGFTPTTYAGQYQQRPAPKDDSEIDIRWFEHTRFDIGEITPTNTKGCNFYMTSDHAPSGHGDYNVFRIWAIDHKRHFWLVDSFRQKCKMQIALGIQRDAEGKLNVTPTGAMRLLQKWKPLAFFPEDDNNWKSIGDLFEQARRETGLWVRILPQPTSGVGDKVVKVQSFCTLAALGQVHIPNGPIGEDALREYAIFPAGSHDDQVDADGMIGRVQTLMRSGYLPKTERQILEERNDYAAREANSASGSDLYFL